MSTKKVNNELMKIDLYNLLGVPEDADTKQVCVFDPL